MCTLSKKLKSNFFNGWMISQQQHYKMATMKKQAKATAVEKGTFYECGWCGKEGTNAPYHSTENEVICGRRVEGEKIYFCGDKCQDIYSLEHNRRSMFEDIDWANRTLVRLKHSVTYYIKNGDKIPPILLQTAKLVNIYKKVLTFIISGDTPSARKLYNEKKEIVTDYIEDLLADKEWEYLYMTFINNFSELNEMMSDGFCV